MGSLLISRTAFLAVFALAATAASADLQVSFLEGAPKDRFNIKNTGNCNITESTLRLNLGTSKGALIFDVTSSGAGVEVSQPFELVEGSAILNGEPKVTDGMSGIDLVIGNMPPGALVSFTIDVDDTLGGREITVTGAEIEGATISFTSNDQIAAGVFSSQSKAEIAIKDC
ncbi:aggregation factor core [Ruegeria arenilitoris]|uniref:aggregation factor core n=1 Tax=Ruegeria arenilitoris TaxID=1173585 RepID=UPI001479FF72|nr:aggregation factor core [Ruegeria arenilitoris]